MIAVGSSFWVGVATFQAVIVRKTSGEWHVLHRNDFAASVVGRTTSHIVHIIIVLLRLTFTVEMRGKTTQDRICLRKIVKCRIALQPFPLNDEVQAPC